MTPQPKSVEEIVEEFDKRFGKMPNDNGIKHAQQLDFIRATLTESFEQGRDTGMKADEVLREEGRMEERARIYQEIESGKHPFYRV